MPRGVYERTPETLARMSAAHMGHSVTTGTRAKLSAANTGNGDQHKTHGMTGTREYYTWSALVQRCTNPNEPGYKNYGGRGITVCERWRNSFANFYADMGEKPASLSIDRIDNNGNYEPKNCRWATRKEQRANQRPTAVRLI